MKYIFFDMGSTLIDEKISDDRRISETLTQPNAPGENVFRELMAEYYRLNCDGYKRALAHFDLNKVTWNCDGERLYPDCHSVLSQLSSRYSLGIIANQLVGSEQRLEAYGIKPYFDIITTSAEIGFAKPDKRIFLAALERADCEPYECAMVGDRLENDIAPAAALGMKTVWIKQGWGALGDVNLLKHSPDFIVENLMELLFIF